MVLVKQGPLGNDFVKVCNLTLLDFSGVSAHDDTLVVTERSPSPPPLHHSPPLSPIAEQQSEVVVVNVPSSPPPLPAQEQPIVVVSSDGESDTADRAPTPPIPSYVRPHTRSGATATFLEQRFELSPTTQRKSPAPTLGMCSLIHIFPRAWIPLVHFLFINPLLHLSSFPFCIILLGHLSPPLSEAGHTLYPASL